MEAVTPTFRCLPLAEADAFLAEIFTVLTIFLDIQRITIESSFDFNPVDHALIAGPIRILKILLEAFSATAKANI
jgi:hypothetical protein